MADLPVDRIRSVRRDGTSRASADVGGHELFFESDALDLVAAPEAFASALLHLAASTGRRLVLDRPLDPRWRRGVARILGQWAEWWGTEPDVDAVVSAPTASLALPRPRPRAAALCFSLGADSFHTLLLSGRRIDLLLMAHGFDIPLADRHRMDRAEQSLRAVSAATGVRHAVVRTNLRDHPACAELDWEAAHGGALAALGHVSSGAAGRLLITSTKPLINDTPWGSHFRTDRWWSGRRLAVVHVGAEERREPKIGQMASEPLVRDHLRVCWENRAPSGNCGRCEKCVRTMLALDHAGELDRVSVFPRGRPLHELVDELPGLSEPLVRPYEALAMRLSDPAVRDAVERLLARSAEPSAHEPGWLARVPKLR